MKKPLIAILAAIVCLGPSPASAYVKSSGLYQPCIIRPEIVRPLIERGEIEKPEIAKPEFDKASRVFPLFDKEPIARPLIDRPDIVKPEFEKCQPSDKSRYSESYIHPSRIPAPKLFKDEKPVLPSQSTSGRGFFFVTPRPTTTAPNTGCCGTSSVGK